MTRPFMPLLRALILALALAACNNNQQTQPTPVPEAEPSPTTAAATATAVPPTATREPSPTPSPEPTETPEPKGEAVEYGEPVRGSIEEEGEESIWLLTGAEDDLVYVTVETVRGQMEPIVTLYDSEENELAEGESTGEFRSGLSYRLEEDGEYLIVVTADDDETGTFELTVLNAQTGGDLEFGDVVTGVLTEDESQSIWSFEGEFGQFVDIEARGEEGLDTTIELVDEDGNTIAYSDDVNGRDPLLTGFPLVKGGTYTIVVAAVGEVSEGTYELELREGEGTTGTIEMDSPVEGELSGGAALYTYAGEAGTAISISADASEGSGLDPAITVYDPDGVELASDDDSGESTNALIRELSLEESGDYFIVVRPIGGEGGYVLTVGPALEATTAGTLAVDQTVQGELSESEEEAWTFEGQSGAAVTIGVSSLEADGLDVKVSLLGPDGEELTSDDDSGEDNDALIEGYPLLEGGTYTVVVSAFSGTGAYEVSLSAVQAGTVAVGDTVQGEIVGDGFQVWTFEGTEGDTVTLSATKAEESADLDLQLGIIGPDGEILYSDDDSGGDLNPLLEDVELPETGTYLIVVTAFSGEGAFDLTLSAAE